MGHESDDDDVFSDHQTLLCQGAKNARMTRDDVARQGSSPYRRLLHSHESGNACDEMIFAQFLVPLNLVVRRPPGIRASLQIVHSCALTTGAGTASVAAIRSVCLTPGRYLGEEGWRKGLAREEEAHT
jgi:hypothetical protein